jgi:hypothetical protein
MYKKPEVTKYSGTELLDLMGPVETAYSSCYLESGQEGCDLMFALGTPEGMVAEDFDGFGFVLKGPDNCGTEKGECVFEGEDDNCIFDSDGELNTKSLVFWTDLCEASCNVDGTWTLEAWWLDGDIDNPRCPVEVTYQEPDG